MRLAWSRTFSDSHHDFVAQDEDEKVGRIRRIGEGHAQAGRWEWSAYGIGGPPRVVGFDVAGVTDSRQEAIDALTSAWGRWIAAGRPKFPGDPGAVC